MQFQNPVGRSPRDRCGRHGVPSLPDVTKVLQLAWRLRKEEGSVNRREFLKIGAGSAALAAAGCASGKLSVSESMTKDKFAGLEALPPMMPNAVVKESALKGLNACKFVDDCIWFLRAVARMKPKSIFDTPYLGAFKKIHDATGLKVQFNMFYRTDYFYGMDEFSLADMPDTYKAEFQANADWIKFGLHAFQEFPDYPWINSDYSDVAKCLKMIRGEVARFAGDNMFARFLLPHWVPMSRDGVKALVDGGIKMMVVSSGNRFAWNGDPAVLPYGHDFRLQNNRKPETSLYTRVSNNLAISSSLCGYNHVTREQIVSIAKYNKYLYDPDTGMRFCNTCTSPMSVLNLQELPEISKALAAVDGCEFVGYGNHEQYFFKDYFLYQPDYMEREMLVAKTLSERGYKFIFMEDLV